VLGELPEMKEIEIVKMDWLDCQNIDAMSPLPPPEALLL
jgi:hypothetical protein